ncbi:hypothetical protein [Variovorax sp. HW608]|uniref:hypothetical protein n=1 Tax=Variovorax sp. HW608 TaxID=1034889 RepID=UPI0012FE4D5B|nr:hypothetical protein [Variovorax sp. HW608]
MENTRPLLHAEPSRRIQIQTGAALLSYPLPSLRECLEATPAPRRIPNGGYRCVLLLDSNVLLFGAFIAYALTSPSPIVAIVGALLSWVLLGNRVNQLRHG